MNGRNLGRYWNIGPQKTLYLPGPWLHQGINQVGTLPLIPGLWLYQDTHQVIALPPDPWALGIPGVWGEGVRALPRPADTWFLHSWWSSRRRWQVPWCCSQRPHIWAGCSTSAEPISLLHPAVHAADLDLGVEGLAGVLC